MRRKKEIVPNNYSRLSLFKGLIARKNSSEVSEPRLKLTASGLSINGFKLDVDIAKLLSSKYGFLLVLACFPTLIKGESSTNYYNDIEGTIYKLWLSGTINLSSVVTRLNQGACSLNATNPNPVPPEWDIVQQYGPNTDLTNTAYAAVLSVEKDHGVIQTAVDCVTDLINAAYSEEVSDSLSYKSILGIVGGFALLCFMVGMAVYFSKKKEKCPAFSKYENEDVTKHVTVVSP